MTDRPYLPNDGPAQQGRPKPSIAEVAAWLQQTAENRITVDEPPAPAPPSTERPLDQPEQSAMRSDASSSATDGNGPTMSGARPAATEPPASQAAARNRAVEVEDPFPDPFATDLAELISKVRASAAEAATEGRARVEDEVVSDPPVVAAPVVSAPVVSAPVVAEPFVAEPVVAEPVVQTPGRTRPEPVAPKPGWGAYGPPASVKSGVQQARQVLASTLARTQATRLKRSSYPRGQLRERIGALRRLRAMLGVVVVTVLLGIAAGAAVGTFLVFLAFAIRSAITSG